MTSKQVAASSSPSAEGKPHRKSTPSSVDDAMQSPKRRTLLPLLRPLPSRQRCSPTSRVGWGGHPVCGRLSEVAYADLPAESNNPFDAAGECAGPGVFFSLMALTTVCRRRQVTRLRAAMKPIPRLVSCFPGKKSPRYWSSLPTTRLLFSGVSKPSLRTVGLVPAS